jgi:hypothetical protein
MSTQEPQPAPRPTDATPTDGAPLCLKNRTIPLTSNLWASPERLPVARRTVFGAITTAA